MQLQQQQIVEYKPNEISVAKTFSLQESLFKDPKENAWGYEKFFRITVVEYEVCVTASYNSHHMFHESNSFT